MQNTPYTDVKVGSWAALAATRSGQKVALSTSVARYSSSYERFIPLCRRDRAGAVPDQGQHDVAR